MLLQERTHEIDNFRKLSQNIKKHYLKLKGFNMLVSRCCKKPLRVEGKGSYYYVCEKCNRATDPIDMKILETLPELYHGQSTACRSQEKGYCEGRV